MLERGLDRPTIPAVVRENTEITSDLVRRLRWAGAIVAGCFVLFLCALREDRVFGTQSDGASQVLQAWAMLHGNLLLHGWYLSDVSFYTTALPEYMLVEIFRGLSPSVVQIATALTYTLLVLLAAYTARGAASGRVGLVRAAIAVAVMLGPSVAAASIVLNDPDHTGTAVPVLVVFALIDRAGKRWFVPVAVGLTLAVALVADPLVLVIGVLPVLVVCGARACRLLLTLRVPLTAAWYEVSLAAAALLAVGAAGAASHLIRASGGYVVSRSEDVFVLPAAMPANVSTALSDFLQLFSGDFFGQRVGAGLAFTAIHLVAAALVAAGLWLGLRRLFGGDLIVSLLATAVAANLLACAVLFQVSATTSREMAPVFALGATLAGRMLAAPLIRNGLELLLVAGMACTVWAMAPGVLISKPSQPSGAALASWLERHHLHEGIAGFWQANAVTLDSGGTVTMRPAHAYARSGVSPLPWELDVPLDDSRNYYADFVVAVPPADKASGITQRQAIAKFGQPHLTYRFEQYVIMVWQRNLLPEFTRPRQ